MCYILPFALLVRYGKMILLDYLIRTNLFFQKILLNRFRLFVSPFTGENGHLNGINR